MLDSKKTLRSIIGALALICAFFLFSSPAKADILLPEGQDNTNFQNGLGGWTTNIDYGGLCLPGVTCAAATGQFENVGGADQSASTNDGFASIQFGGVASLGANFIATTQSPEFTIPQSWSGNANLSIRVRNNFPGLLPVDYSAYSRLNLLDVSNPNTPHIVASREDHNNDNDWSYVLNGDVSNQIVAGKTYRIQVVSSITGPLGVAVGGSFDYDNPRLVLIDSTNNGGNGTGTGSGNGTGGDGTGGTGSGNNNGNDGNGNGGNGTGNTGSSFDAAVYGAMLRQCVKSDLLITSANRTSKSVKVSGVSGFAAGTQVVIKNQNGKTVGKGKTNSSGKFAIKTSKVSTKNIKKTRYRAWVNNNTKSTFFHLRRNNYIRSVSVKGSTILVKGTVAKSKLKKRGSNRDLQIRAARGTNGCGKNKSVKLLKNQKVSISKSGKYTVRARLSGNGPVLVKTIKSKRIHSPYFVK